MLFEGCYSSSFKPNPKKEGASFFASVSNANDGPLNNGKGLPNGFWKVDKEEKEKRFDASNAKSEAFPTPLFGIFPEGEKGSWKDAQSWNIPFSSSVEISSLDDLASDHLRNHTLSTRCTAGAEPLLSDKVASKLPSQNRIPATEAEDDLERMDDLDAEVRKPCLDAVVIGVKELSLEGRHPSSFGRVLCRKVGPSRKNQVPFDARLLCPPQITPFNFTTPSPDDIVRNSQKLRK